MNVVERVIRKLDRAQQRRRRLGFVVGVVKKFGDDRCSTLAVMLTYYAFVSIFPLLLVLTTILGFIGNESLSRQHHRHHPSAVSRVRTADRQGRCSSVIGQRLRADRRPRGHVLRLSRLRASGAARDGRGVERARRAPIRLLSPAARVR